jgi:hypothetical protein
MADNLTRFATPLYMEISLPILKEHESSHSSSWQQAHVVQMLLSVLMQLLI